MAQKVQVLLIDDVDGAAADETVTFALDGVTYEIDLTAERAAQLRDSLATWVGHARRVGGRSTSAARPAATSRRRRGDNDAQAIREWAKSQGLTVSERGRISAEVREAYDKAH